MEQLTLYHAGFAEIRRPDIHMGRSNADFGQGFYLSPQEAFCRRWARSRQGQHTWLNVYTLNTEGLAVKSLARDAEWFDYILHNRAGRRDALAEYDVISGPIANDTLFDLWGVTTSGLLRPEQALRLLTAGPVYIQTVVKTQRAADRLRLVSARILPESEIAEYRQAVRREERQYQNEILPEIRRIADQDD